ncbi:MAG: hypothetical protein B7X90_02685 [Novosphingobium sp. 17-62-19]|uniref:hypothetical protein n=1 Tax=Novosphingobium sp. 17-62-19 TaxID=1970406 RepID=UPI000BC78248|nr:hypothetical protein [Novosphingobium sp. 17-62-19]OYX91886.1 MAG: hypothetical protein B7Y74_13450 [Novosphingobium sp. 35-62-5]OZA21271.1 MAG: hypothetical protein B7X90_02685 [Novosphingobium sp. 17-62-19]HQS98173.1 hypothetical protein [Novosphingobium sp.]
MASQQPCQNDAYNWFENGEGPKTEGRCRLQVAMGKASELRIMTGGVQKIACKQQRNVQSVLAEAATKVYRG